MWIFTQMLARNHVHAMSNPSNGQSNCLDHPYPFETTAISQKLTLKTMGLSSSLFLFLRHKRLGINEAATAGEIE
uniref:Uncharacterized protein n=2 Tax=Caenorhabditis japonica TaxID=281687 RepID=A0A8R1EGG1_CAEJA